MSSSTDRARDGEQARLAITAIDREGEGVADHRCSRLRTFCSISAHLAQAMLDIHLQSREAPFCLRACRKPNIGQDR